MAEYLQGQTLFPVPRFILVKRLTQAEKAPGYANSKAAAALLKESLAQLDTSVTVVLWEPSNLAPTHPLFKQMAAWQEQGIAKLRHFPLPTERSVAQLAHTYLTERGSGLTQDAGAWLRQEYAMLGKKARLAKRLRAGEELLQDERGWWLYQLLDSALLQAAGGEVTPEHLGAGQADASAVGVFEVATALANRRFGEARRLLRLLEEEGDDGVVFSLIAAVRWQLSQSGQGKQGQAASRRLAELELILKNFSPSPWWLLDVLLNRLEGIGIDEGLVPARRMWLAHLART